MRTPRTVPAISPRFARERFPTREEHWRLALQHTDLETGRRLRVESAYQAVTSTSSGSRAGFGAGLACGSHFNSQTEMIGMNLVSSMKSAGMAAKVIAVMA